MENKKNEKNYQFYKPIKLKEYSFFIRNNSTQYARLITIIPKKAIRSACERNKIRRKIRTFFFKSSLANINLDVIISINKQQKNYDNIFLSINKIWSNFS